MPLTNFGAILTFAETVEREDMEFYEAAAAAVPQVDLFGQLARESSKNLSLVQRTRRENVTEMILEAIHNFSRDRYRLERAAAFGADAAGAARDALIREKRAIAYYSEAADKIKALPEVARVLKTLAKKRSKRLLLLEKLAAEAS